MNSNEIVKKIEDILTFKKASVSSMVDNIETLEDISTRKDVAKRALEHLRKSKDLHIKDIVGLLKIDITELFDSNTHLLESLENSDDLPEGFELTTCAVSSSPGESDCNCDVEYNFTMLEDRPLPVFDPNSPLVLPNEPIWDTANNTPYFPTDYADMSSEGPLDTKERKTIPRMFVMDDTLYGLSFKIDDYPTATFSTRLQSSSLTDLGNLHTGFFDDNITLISPQINPESMDPIPSNQFEVEGASYGTYGPVVILDIKVFDGVPYVLINTSEEGSNGTYPWGTQKYWYGELNVVDGTVNWLWTVIPHPLGIQDGGYFEGDDVSGSIIGYIDNQLHFIAKNPDGAVAIKVSSNGDFQVQDIHLTSSDHHQEIVHTHMKDWYLYVVDGGGVIHSYIYNADGDYVDITNVHVDTSIGTDPHFARNLIRHFIPAGDDTFYMVGERLNLVKGVFEPEGLVSYTTVFDNYTESDFKINDTNHTWYHGVSQFYDDANGVIILLGLVSVLPTSTHYNNGDTTYTYGYVVYDLASGTPIQEVFQKLCYGDCPPSITPEEVIRNQIDDPLSSQDPHSRVEPDPPY